MKTLGPLTLLLLSACPLVTPNVCDVNTCSGCCDDNGQCQSGALPNACGMTGRRCSVCPAGLVCFAGACTFSGGVGGGSTAGGGQGGGATAGGQGGGATAGGQGGGATAGGQGGGATAGGQGGGATAGGQGGGNGGGAVAGGQGGGGGGGTGGGTPGGGQGGGGGSGGGGVAPCGPGNCAGCCSSAGVCANGTSPGACGARGIACFTCVANQVCSNGGCTGTETATSGQPCTFNADCSKGVTGLTQQDCITVYRPDGGPTGWLGGYCSNAVCLGSFTCPGFDAVCGADSYCYDGCSPIFSGQATCRPGYVCSPANADGGGTGICVPNCNSPGLSPACPGGTTCMSNGYCL